MRKTIAVLAAFCMAAALCACSGKAAEEKETGAQKTQESVKESAEETAEESAAETAEEADDGSAEGAAEGAADGGTGFETQETIIVEEEALQADPAANVAATGAGERSEASQIANPITEYQSLEEINEVTGGKLSAPEGREVSDEYFTVIDTGVYKIAQYEFVMDDVLYCYRFAADIVFDISGIYVDEGSLFADTDDKGTEFAEYDTGKAGRCFTADGQYVLSAEDLGKMDMESFEKVAQEMFDAASGK